MLAGDLCRMVKTETGSAIGLPLALRFLNKRYAQLVALNGGLRTEMAQGELVMPAVITAGEVTVTKGSRRVVGDADAQAAWNERQDFFGTVFRMGDTEPVYAVESRQGSQLVLAAEYVDEGKTGGYEVLTRHHRLDPRARHVVNMIAQDERLQESTREELDALFPRRLRSHNRPHSWAVVGDDLDTGGIVVEIYPPADNRPVHIRYSFQCHPEEFRVGDELPRWLDPHLLEVGLMADFANFDKAAALKERPPMVEVAALMSQDAARHERRFQEMRHEAAQAARAGRPPRIRRIRLRGGGDRDIEDVRDEILDSL